MGYRDTKTEGPAANAVSAMLTLAAKKHALNDVQVLSIFSELAKQTPADATPPAPSQWTTWIDRAHRKVDNAALSAARTASLHTRLDAARDGLPAARVWFALRHLDADASSRAAALDGYLAQIGRINGRVAQDVRAEFEARIKSIGTARSNGDGRETRTAFYGHIPSDYATVTVLADMRREAAQGHVANAIEHVNLPVGVVSSYGYHAATQRLEVKMSGSVYAYRVPQKVVSVLAALDHSTDAPSAFIATKVFPNPAFAWDPSGETVRVCPACNEPVARVHVCQGPSYAPYATPAVVDLDPGTERVAADGTVLALLRSGSARAELATKGHVTTAVVVITAPDDAASVLGARYTITGDVTVTADSVDASALACSCPAPACAHRVVAARQVQEMILWGVVPDAAEVS